MQAAAQALRLEVDFSVHKDAVERSSAYLVYQIVFIALYVSVCAATVRVLHATYSPGKPLRSARWQTGALLVATTVVRGLTFLFIPDPIEECLRALKDILLTAILTVLIAYWAQVSRFVFDRALTVTRYRPHMVAAVFLFAAVRVAQAAAHIVDRNSTARLALALIFVVFLGALFCAGLVFGLTVLRRLRVHARVATRPLVAHVRAHRVSSFLVGMTAIAAVVLATWSLRYTVFAGARCKEDGSNSGTCDPTLWFFLKLVEKVAELCTCALLLLIIRPAPRPFGSRKPRGSVSASALLSNLFHRLPSVPPAYGDGGEEREGTTAAGITQGASSHGGKEPEGRVQPLWRTGPPRLDDDSSSRLHAREMGTTESYRNPLSSIQADVDAGAPAPVAGSEDP